MFRTLLIKEWRERLLIVIFGLGLMVILLAAFLIFADTRDLREIIPVGFLIVFFPFIALILGSGAFEAEFRSGSWAYLLSRPVRKGTIWLAKLAALLSIMAAFWLLFLGLMAVVPGIGEVVAGFKLPEMLRAGLEFFPLILLSSFFYFSVAFALSILSERQISLVFGSFFVGAFIQVLLTYVSFQAGGRGYLTAGGLFPWLDAYKLALVLSSLAFLAASLFTFRHADFSQPKMRIQALIKYTAVFLALAWLLTAAWTALGPGLQEKFNSGIEVTAGKAFFSTTRGLYRYDVAGDKVSRLTARGRYDFSTFVLAGGKVLYTGFAGWDAGFVLRVMDMDGSGKRLLIGGGPDDPHILGWAFDFALSPRGETAVIHSEDFEGPRRRRTYKKTLWSIQTDGTGLKKLPPLDPALAGNGKDYSWLRILAWSASVDRLLMMSRPQEGSASLWSYVPATGVQACLFEGPRVAPGTVSPAGDAVMVAHQPEVKGPVEMFLLDIVNREKIPVMTVDSPGASIWSILNAVWSRKGDRVAFLVQKSRGVFSVAVFSRPDRRLIEEKGLWAEKPSPQEPSSLTPSIDWIDEDTRLILGVPKERCLKVLGLDLAVEKKIPVPPRLGKEYGVRAAGDAVLIQDFTNVTVWRLDLKTDNWKKIW